ncbi:MAG: N-acetyl-gamma-glutamyl-phosphate reductase [Armatimonadaceae bacterium]
MISTTIVGASGYGGGELARLLDGHPEFDVVQVLSNTFAGQPFAAAFNGMYGTPTGDLICAPTSDAPTGELIFLAQESGYAMRVAADYLAAGKRVIDLSADFRLTSPDVYRAYYKSEPAPTNVMEHAVYGMPELFRDKIKDAKLIANPGCYVTASTLAIKPLLDAGLLLGSGIIIDAKSGVSGAGRSKNDAIYKYSEANEAMRVYGVGGVHRHTPEIEQNLGVKVLFTPHLVPMSRGILATCYLPAKGGVTLNTAYDALVAAYANEPFVTVRPLGDFPSSKDVAGTNRVHIALGFAEASGMLIAVSAIDNLIKGAAGQAIQNANIMYGLPETMGLAHGGIWP